MMPPAGRGATRMALEIGGAAIYDQIMIYANHTLQLANLGPAAPRARVCGVVSYAQPQGCAFQRMRFGLPAPPLKRLS